MYIYFSVESIKLMYTCSIEIRLLLIIKNETVIATTMKKFYWLSVYILQYMPFHSASSDWSTWGKRRSISGLSECIAIAIV